MMNEKLEVSISNDDKVKESEGIQNVLKLTVEKLLTQLSGLK